MSTFVETVESLYIIEMFRDANEVYKQEQSNRNKSQNLLNKKWVDCPPMKQDSWGKRGLNAT